MLEYRRLIKRFGDRTILRGIDLSIGEGQIVFILGTSGTGKSVLLKTTVGLLRADGGEILIDGRDTAQYSEEEYRDVRKICGMVFQQPALFDSLSVFDNVAFGLRRHHGLRGGELADHVALALGWVQMSGSEKLMPAELSYGMQKRVSLARTVALQPRILLFDEPTTGLDPLTTVAINRLILDLSRRLKTTSIVVSHDMICALEIADHIVVLDQGQIVDQGSPAQIRKSRVPLVADFLAEVPA